MKVYVEHGALRDELYQLERQGQIQLVTFPYEATSRKIHGRADPSEAQIRDLGHITIDEMDFSIDAISKSSAYDKILSIVGSRNRIDALHIDSAYKSRCRAFFSRDSKHIIRNREALHDATGIRFFHPDSDWTEFIIFLSCP